MDKVDSLYNLIKQTAKRKNRPLKIVCDWDEVIQPVSPLMWHKVAEKKGWKVKPFEEYFNYYWTHAKIEYKQNIPYTRDTGIEEIEKIRKRTDAQMNYPKDFDYLDYDPDKYDNEFNREVRTLQYKVLNDANYYEEAPFLSFAEDLLKALDEGLIERLSFITTTRGVDHRKQRVFDKVFKKKETNKTEITLFPQGHYRKTGERRVDIIEQKWPDFDMFIDDSVGCIKDALQKFPDRIYVCPNYIINDYPKAENVYLLDIAVSSLKQKTLKKMPKETTKNINPNNTIYWVIGGMAIIFFLLGLSAWLFIRKRKEKDSE